MSPTTGGYEEQPTIHGRIAMRVDELPESGAPDILEHAYIVRCSGCGAHVIEPAPPSGVLAGLHLPAICRPCVKAAIGRGEVVMAAQPFADRAP